MLGHKPKKKPSSTNTNQEDSSLLEPSKLTLMVDKVKSPVYPTVVARDYCCSGAEMPENETLLYDARSVSRWQPIGESMDNGLPTNKAFPAIQDAFYGLFQSVWSQWRDCGVNAPDLFRAALEDHNTLRELIRQTNFDLNVQLLRDVALSLEDPDMEGLISAFLDAAWDSAQGQLQLDCREDTPSPEFMNQIQGMLDRIRRSLLNNLSRFPSRIRREPPPDMGTRLGENLL